MIKICYDLLCRIVFLKSFFVNCILKEVNNKKYRMREQNFLKMKCNQTITGEFVSAEVLVSKKSSFGKKKLMSILVGSSLLLLAYLSL